MASPGWMPPLIVDGLPIEPPTLYDLSLHVTGALGDWGDLKGASLMILWPDGRQSGGELSPTQMTWDGDTLIVTGFDMTRRPGPSRESA